MDLLGRFRSRVFGFKNWQHPLIWPLTLGAFLIPSVWSRSLNDNFTEAKWLAVRLVAAALLMVASTTMGSFRIPRLRPIATLSVLLWIVLSIVNPVLQGTYYWPVDIWLDRVVLIALIVLLLQFESAEQMLKSLRWPIAAASVFVCLVSLVQFVQYRVLEIQPSPRFFAGTFGENNMCAQFLSLALAMVLPKTVDGESRLWRYVSTVASTLSLIFLFIHQSRSALIGAGLTICFLILFSQRAERLRIIVVVLTGFVLSLILTAAQPWKFQINDKSSSNSDRRELYIETLGMIQARPMGVGTGRFEFDSIPFLQGGQFQAGEGMIYKSPHSEPLRFLAEEGVIWTVIGILVSMGTLWSSNLIGAIRQRRFEAIRITALGLAFVPEFLFQFPLQSAVAFFFFSTLVAALLHLHKVPALTRPFDWRIRLAGWGVAIGILAVGGAISYSNFQATTASHPDDYVRSCERASSNWYTCSLAAQFSIESGHLDRAKTLMKNEISKRPFNFMALRNLGMAAWRQGDLVMACEYFIREQAILRSNNSNREFVEANCPVDVLNRLKSLDADALYGEHLDWVKHKIASVEKED